MNSLTDLLAQLARMGVILWQEHGELRWEAPPEAALGPLPQQIESHATQLLECCYARHRRDPLSCPLAVRPGSLVNVLCLHPMNGGVCDYRHLAAGLPAVFSVHGFQAVNWLLDGTIPDSVERMAQSYARSVLESPLCEQPAILVGVSSGGLMALEMARHLADAGCKPLAVILGDTRDWATTESAASRILLDRMVWQGLIETYLPLELVREIFPHAHPFWTLDEADRIDYLVSHTGSLSGAQHLVPVTPDSLRQRLPPYRSYIKSYRRYEPGACEVRSVYLMSSRGNYSQSEKIRGLLLLSRQHRVVTLDGGHLAALAQANAPCVAKVMLEEARSVLGES